MTIYLLHGALGSAAQLHPLAARLRQRTRDFRVVEFAGHGNTPLGTHSFTVSGFVEQLLVELEKDGLESADFFGYSMGGYVALALALAHPDRVRTIVTLGTKFDWTPEIAARDAARLDPAVIKAKVPRFAEQLEARHGGAGGWEGVLTQTANLLTELGQQPVIDASALEKIEQRVRITVGDRDATVSVEESTRVSRALGRGELAVLPGTPHPLEQVDHEWLVELIEPFRHDDAVPAAPKPPPASQFAEFRKLSLYRGDRLVGRIHRYTADDESVRTGFLILASDDERLENMMQVRYEMPSDTRVFQHRIEPHESDENRSRTHFATSATIGLRQLSEEEARGVAPELVYSIRDESGAELPSRMIVLKKWKITPGSERAMFGGRMPPDARLDGAVWMVNVSLQPELSSELQAKDPDVLMH
ncbi:MAG: alpha/beta hydrolase [bacterium]